MGTAEYWVLCYEFGGVGTGLMNPCPQIAVAFGPGHPLESPARVFQ